MPAITTRVLPLTLCLLAAACSSPRPLPKYEKPIARTSHQHVRTTAYTHSESDHIQHGRSTAAGGRLRYGTINSAACDWSRWPVGTIFRLKQTNEIFEVDDYGWALSGTNTIDLYKPSRRAMNTWGVRRVDIEILRWGDVDRSLAILRPRLKHRHVRRMVDQIEDRYAELSRPLEQPVLVAENVSEETFDAPVAGRAEPAMRAQPVAIPVSAARVSTPAARVPVESAPPQSPAVSGNVGVRVASGGFVPSGPASMAPLKPFHSPAPR